jgi:hypothetical protein
MCNMGVLCVSIACVLCVSASNVRNVCNVCNCVWHPRVESAPSLHPLYTLSAPSLHPLYTLSAPSLHPLYTLSTPSLHPRNLTSKVNTKVLLMKLSYLKGEYEGIADEALLPQR